MKNAEKETIIEISPDDLFKLRNINIGDAVYVGENTIWNSNVRPGYPLSTLEIIFSSIHYSPLDSVLTIIGNIADMRVCDTSIQGRITFGSMPTTEFDTFRHRKVKIYDTYQVSKNGYFNIEYPLRDSMILYISTWRDDYLDGEKSLMFLSYVSAFNVYELVNKQYIKND